MVKSGYWFVYDYCITFFAKWNQNITISLLCNRAEPETKNSWHKRKHLDQYYTHIETIHMFSFVNQFHGFWKRRLVVLK